jgi:hypothetical protein
MDDIFGIWIPPTKNRLATWNVFKTALNNWGKLEWVIEEPSLKTTFLDLNISIERGSITTSIYQKDMNLYLYIPPSSAHSPCCFKGLIARELRRYFIQNNKEGFETMLTKFTGRHLDRRHSLNNILPLLLQAAANLDTNPSRVTEKDCNSMLYIHWPLYPKGLQRQHLRQLYDNMLKNILPFQKMQVTISRLRNLRDVLTKAAINLPQDFDINHAIYQATTNDNQMANS